MNSILFVGTGRVGRGVGGYRGAGLDCPFLRYSICFTYRMRERDGDKERKQPFYSNASSPFLISATAFIPANSFDALTTLSLLLDRGALGFITQ